MHATSSGSPAAYVHAGDRHNQPTGTMRTHDRRTSQSCGGGGWGAHSTPVASRALRPSPLNSVSPKARETAKMSHTRPSEIQPPVPSTRAISSCTPLPCPVTLFAAALLSAGCLKVCASAHARMLLHEAGAGLREATSFELQTVIVCTPRTDSMHHSSRSE